MYRLEIVGDAGGAEHGPCRDIGSCSDTDGPEVGDGRLQATAVVDGDGQPPGDRTGERRPAGAGRSDRTSLGGRQVDAPMPGVGPGGGERLHHRAGDRRLQTGARRTEGDAGRQRTRYDDGDGHGTILSATAIAHRSGRVRHGTDPRGDPWRASRDTRHRHRSAPTRQNVRSRFEEAQ